MKNYGNGLLLICAFGAMAGPAFAGNLTFLATPGTAVDSVDWSAIGGDGTLFSAGTTVDSVDSNLTTIDLGTQPTLGGLTSVVCPAVNPVDCSWGHQPSGYGDGDTLIWLEGLDSNSNPVGTGPLTLSLNNSVGGLGEYLQATSPGQFSVSLGIYNGASLLGSLSYTSDLAGDPLFVGVQDTAVEINKAVISVTACGSFNCDANDFSADSLQIYSAAAAGTPEPSTFALGGGLLAIGLARRFRQAKGNE
jgi:hypothetical protein